MSHVTVSFLNVGQGDCTVVIDHEAHVAMLIDCPRGSEAVAVREIEASDADLDTVVVTHSHLDHFGGVLDTIETLGCRRLLYNHDALIAAPPETVPGGGRRTDPAVVASLRRILELREAQLGPATPAMNGAVGNAAFWFLAPSHRDLTRAVVTRRPNAASAILLIEIDGIGVVIGGDADADVWRRLVLANRLPRVFAMRWPHHGGDLDEGSPGLAAAILDHAAPEVVTLSIGGANTYGHPSESFLTALLPRTPTLMCTEATPKCTAHDPEVCAASIRLEISNGAVTTVPSLANHAVRVRQFARPRCLA